MALNAGRAPEDRIRDQEIWRRAQQCSTPDLLRAMRLRHFRRVAASAPAFLKGLLQLLAHREDSWAATIQQDLLCLSEACASEPVGSKAASLPPPDTDPQAWEHFALAQPEAWSTLIAKHILGKLHVPAPSPPAVEEAMDIPCPSCSMVFASIAARNSHTARSHGYRNPVRARIHTEHCTCCMLHFWSRERVLYHVRKSKRCLAYHMSYVPAMRREEADALDAQSSAAQTANLRSGLQPRFAHLPCVRAAGPRTRDAALLLAPHPEGFEAVP